MLAVVLVASGAGALRAAATESGPPLAGAASDRLNPPAAPDVQGSVVNGTAHLSWSAVSGATSYKVYRKCQMSDGYTLGWELWDVTASTSYATFDYVMSYAGTSPPSSAYFGYYVVATGPGGDSANSTIRYFAWDDVAEPGC